MRHVDPFKEMMKEFDASAKRLESIFEKFHQLHLHIQKVEKEEAAEKARHRRWCMLVQADYRNLFWESRDYVRTHTKNGSDERKWMIEELLRDQRDEANFSKANEREEREIR